MSVPGAGLGADAWLGSLSPGKRADLVVLDAKTRHICATLSGGRISYLSGEAARRFIG